MAAVLRQSVACVRLLSSNLMTRNKKHGWLRRMVGFVIGCAVVATLDVAGTNLATVATTRDAIVDTETAATFGADAVVVLGASVFADGSCTTVVAEPVDVVDSIGAGDAHLGALVAARAAGRTWKDALAIANCAAAAVCQVEGGVLDDKTFASLGIRV